MKTPSRFDKKYFEIEKFKDYEMTQCIAYEMAIRNPDVKKLVEERNAIDIFGDLTQSEVNIFLKVKSDKQATKAIQTFFRNKPERKKWLDDEIRLDAEIKKLSYFSIPSISDSISDQLLENPSFKKWLDKVSQRTQALKSSIIKSEGLGIKKMFEDDGMVATKSGSTINYESLFPKFSRPLPEIPTATSKEIDLLLNLALPTKEITALLESIKRVYDESKGEVYKALIPLDVMSNIDKELFSIRIKVKKKGSNTSLEMPEKRQQEVYADLLFLYDVFTVSNIKKQGDKILHFQNQLIDYYATKVSKYHGIKDIDEVSEYIGTPRDQSVREYYKMMQQYIDDFGYKKLIA